MVWIYWNWATTRWSRDYWGRIWLSSTSQELCNLRSPWKKSLIIQAVGYKKLIRDIKFRLQRIWKTKETLEVIDLGQGFYIVRFSVPEEYILALGRGPWFIFKYHLDITQWRPNFKKEFHKKENFFIWIQLAELLVEYFNSEPVFKLAREIGRHVKMDIHTSESQGVVLPEFV